MHEHGRPLQAPHFARRNLEAPPSRVKKTQCDICGGFRGRNGLMGQGFFGFPMTGAGGAANVRLMQVVSAPANSAEAHMLTHFLAQHGIEAQIMGAQLQGAMGDLPSSNFVRVMVPDEDLERARRLISELESSHRAEPGLEERPRPSWIPLTAIAVLTMLFIYFLVWLRTS